MANKLEFLIKLRSKKMIGKPAYNLLKVFGVEIPPEVIIGKGFKILHSGYGVVIHPDTIIKDSVRIYHGVTLGRADAYLPKEFSKMGKIILDDNSVICAGAKILCKNGVLRVGKNTVIGANAVLTTSTGDNEIWAGNPARKIGIRKEY